MGLTTIMLELGEGAAIFPRALEAMKWGPGLLGSRGVSVGLDITQEREVVWKGSDREQGMWLTLCLRGAGRSCRTAWGRIDVLARRITREEVRGMSRWTQRCLHVC